jgi:CAAX protease family protein
VTVRRRAVIAAGIGGAGLMGAALSSPPRSRRFYLLATGLAGTWTVGSLGSGALGSGALAFGRLEDQRQGWGQGLTVPVLTGGGAFGLCYGAARIARHVPALDRAIRGALRYEQQGSTPLVMLIACANAVAEELFFRGALWALVADSRPVVTTTLAYTAAITTTGNPALVLAGTAISVLSGLQRRASGSALAPAVSHLTWSLLMLHYLPPVFRTPGEPGSEAAATRRPGWADGPPRRRRTFRAAAALRFWAGAAGAGLR